MTAFSAALRRAMGDRPRSDLYRATGVCSTLAKRWLEGACTPDHEHVITIAEHLAAPELVALSIRLRTGTCEGCGGLTFVNRGTRRARFCGPRCRRRDMDRRRQRREGDQERKVLRLAVEEHRAAVLAHCLQCEPDRLCRDAGCALRPVSPLKIDRRVVRAA